MCSQIRRCSGGLSEVQPNRISRRKRIPDCPPSILYSLFLHFVIHLLVENWQDGYTISATETCSFVHFALRSRRANGGRSWSIWQTTLCSNQVRLCTWKLSEWRGGTRWRGLHVRDDPGDNGHSQTLTHAQVGRGRPDHTCEHQLYDQKR